jgi:chaperonin GroEL
MMLDICRVPATLIIQSVSTDYAYIIADIEHNDKKEYGYDAKGEHIEEDMFKAGIIDPVKVEKTALAYSTSVAGIFITTECIITDENENISLVPTDEVSERTDFDYGQI